MSVGGIRGGSKGGKATGAGGASGAGGAGAAKSKGGSTFGKVDATDSLVGASGLVASGNVGAEPVLTAQALAIAQQIQAGVIGSKAEATKRFVAEVLKEKLRVNSKALTQKIAETLQDDPRLNQALERIWSKG